VVVAGKLKETVEEVEDNSAFGMFSARGVNGEKVVENITIAEGAVVAKKNTTVRMFNFTVYN